MNCISPWDRPHTLRDVGKTSVVDWSGHSSEDFILKCATWLLYLTMWLDATCLRSCTGFFCVLAGRFTWIHPLQAICLSSPWRGDRRVFCAVFTRSWYAEKSWDVFPGLTALMFVSSVITGLILPLLELVPHYNGAVKRAFCSAIRSTDWHIKWKFGARSMFSGWSAHWAGMSLSLT